MFAYEICMSCREYQQSPSNTTKGIQHRENATWHSARSLLAATSAFTVTIHLSDSGTNIIHCHGFQPQSKHPSILERKRAHAHQIGEPTQIATGVGIRAFRGRAMCHQPHTLNTTRHTLNSHPLNLQGHLADKKQPPPLTTTIGP